MNRSPAKDVSLYDCALSASAPPHPLQVSPATLKSMVGAIIDLLVEQKIPATLWVKLPHGETWHADIQRYRDLVGGSYPVYICDVIRDRDTLFPLPASSANAGQEEELRSPLGGLPRTPVGETSLISDEGTISIPAKTPSPLVSIPLAPNTQLLREYFLLVLSPKFSGLILAHRPRSVRHPQGEHLSAELNTKHPLLALYSFEGPTIQLVLDGLKVAVSLGQKSFELAMPSGDRADFSAREDFPHYVRKIASHAGESTQGSEPLSEKQKTSFTFAANDDLTSATHSESKCESEGKIAAHSSQTQGNTQDSAQVEELLANWDSQFDPEASEGLDPAILGHLLSKQIQRQEEVWQSAATYRTQAAAGDELHRQNEELQNALRLKDEFLNNVGQELRTPLTNMKTALTLLNSAKLKQLQRDRYMDFLERACDRQTSLLNGLLELVQLERPVEQTDMQPLRLADIVPGVVSTYQPLAQEKGIMLAYTVPDDLPAVSCISEWLKKIAINLLHNGIKFTPSGGEVWVNSNRQGDYVQLEFRDTGIGIPSSEIPKIFDRFYRGRQPPGEDNGGAGLGLTVVQQLLMHCGGSISVKSKLGEGSTFKVLLPIYPES